MIKTAFILIVGIFAHLLFMTTDAAATVPIYGEQFVHHWAGETPSLDETIEGIACSENALLLVSRELRVSIGAGFAVWPQLIRETESQSLGYYPPHVPPDTARALLQVYRI